MIKLLSHRDFYRDFYTVFGRKTPCKTSVLGVSVREEHRLEPHVFYSQTHFVRYLCIFIFIHFYAFRF